MIDADYTLQEVVRMATKIYFAINRPELDPAKLESLYKSVVQDLGWLKEAAIYAYEHEHEEEA